MAYFISYFLTAVILFAQPSWSAPRDCRCSGSQPPKAPAIASDKKSAEAGMCIEESNECKGVEVKEDQVKKFNATAKSDDMNETTSKNVSTTTDSTSNITNICIDDLSINKSSKDYDFNSKSVSDSKGCSYGCSKSWCNMSKQITEMKQAGGDLSCYVNWFNNKYNSNYSSSDADNFTSVLLGDACVLDEDSSSITSTNTNESDKKNTTIKELGIAYEEKKNKDEKICEEKNKYDECSSAKVAEEKKYYPTSKPPCPCKNATSTTTPPSPPPCPPPNKPSPPCLVPEPVTPIPCGCDKKMKCE